MEVTLPPPPSMFFSRMGRTCLYRDIGPAQKKMVLEQQNIVFLYVIFSQFEIWHVMRHS